MNNYTTYNLVLAALILPASYWLAEERNRRKDLLVSARVASLLALLGYPWDFFAIQLKVWRYPINPGPRIHDVPINDLVFMWLCSHLASSVLIAIDRRESRCQGHSERKHARQEHAG